MNSVAMLAAVVFLFTARYGDTSMKTYMDYGCITDTHSTQYQIQQECHTDCNGLRRYTDDEYVVAVGSKIADVGEHITVTFDTGEVLECIVGDSKGNRWYHTCGRGRNVVEFIVDVDVLNDEARKMGDVSCIVGDGAVTKIEKDNS